MKVLYISYDGILEPLGFSQVFRYLEKISSKQIEITLITFEKKINLKDKEKLNELKQLNTKSNINWYYFVYHKNPEIIATIYDLLICVLKICFSFFNKKIDLIHIRGYVPMILGLILKKIYKAKLLFDTRGFWPDEKLDRAGWKKSSLKYRFFKSAEQTFLNKSNAIVCLTKEAKEIYLSENKNLSSEDLYLIRTCVDTDKFNIKLTPKKQCLTFGYIGTTDTAYDIKKVLNFYYKFNETYQSLFYIYTNSDHKFLLENIPGKFIDAKNIIIKRVHYRDIPSALEDIDVGIFFLKENFSIKASMPTKIGEFLACGIPIVCNQFNQDIKEIISNRNGYILDFDSYHRSDFDEIQNLNRLDKSTIRRNAISSFSLTDGAKKYKDIYLKLLND